MNDPAWLKILIPTGSLIIGILGTAIKLRVQGRRQDYELRQQLITDMTATVSALYLSTQLFWRERGQPNTATGLGRTDVAWLESSDPGERMRISRQREALNKQYLKTRKEGAAVEARLTRLFESDEPRSTFHSTTDLLTVRYFQLVGGCTRKLREKNAISPEKRHSGLTADQLENPKKILGEYHDVVKSFPSVVSDARRRKFTVGKGSYFSLIRIPRQRRTRT